MWKMKLIIALIIVLPLLGMTAASVVFLISIGKDLMSRLPEIAREIASEHVNGTLTIGKIEFLDAGGMVLSDVILTEEDTDTRIIHMPRVTLYYSLKDLLLRRADAAGSISKIELEEPSILLERSVDGRWNVADVLKPPPPGRPIRIRAEILVKSGQVVLSDLAHDPKEPRLNILRELNAVLDLSDLPVAKYSVSGVGEPGRLGKFSVEGRYNLSNHSFRLDLDAPSASASYWSDYPVRLGLDVVSGEAQVGLKLSRTSGNEPLQYEGAANLRNAAVEFEQIRSPVCDVEGTVGFDNSAVSLQLEAMLGTTALLVSGHVLNPSSPRLSLSVTSDRTNFRQILGMTAFSKEVEGITLPDRGRCKAVITGAPASPQVSFTVEAPSLAYADFDGSSIIAYGEYADGKITVRQASVGTLGGIVSMQGEIDLSDDPRVSLSGQLAQIDLGRIPYLEEHGLAGQTAGLFDLSWSSDELSIGYSGSLSQGRFRDLPFRNGAVIIAYSGDGLSIQELSAETLNGVVIATGRVASDGELDLQVAASDISLGDVSRLAGIAPASGRASLSGRLTGTLDSPAFEGDMEARQVTVAGTRFDHISSGFRIGREKIGIRGRVIHDPSGMVVVTGAVNNPLGDEPTVDLLVSADSLKIGGFREDFESGVFSGGELSGELIVSGPIFAPEASGALSIRDVSIRGIPLDEATAHVGYREGTFSLEEVVVRSGDSLVTASGEMSGMYQLCLDFESDRLSLQLFNDLLSPYAYASGYMVAHGNVSGALTDLTMQAEFDCDNPRVNGQRFERLSGTAFYRDSSFTVSDLILSDRGAQYTLDELVFYMPSGPFTLSAGLVDAQAAKMLAILDASPAIKSADDESGVRRFLNRLPRPISATVDGRVSGIVHRGEEGISPDLQGWGTMSDASFGSQSIRTVEMEGSWENGVAKLKRLQAIDGDTNVYAEAQYGPSDYLQASVDAHGLSMDMLRQWVDIPDNFSGNADVTIVASGSAHAPVLDASVEVLEPTIGNTRFDRLRSRLSANGDQVPVIPEDSVPASARIDIDELTLVLGEHRLKAAGYLPVDWKGFAVPTDAPLRLETRLDDASLELVSILSGIDARTATEGRLEGFVKLSGTIESPELGGNLVWQGGQVRMPRIHQPFENINARLQLVEDRVVIRSFTGDSPEGGSFEITGSVALADLRPMLELRVTADRLALSGSNFSGTHGEEVSALLDGSVTIAGNWESPLVSGHMYVPEGLISLPSKSEEWEGNGKPFPLNPEFDITARLDRTVQLRAPRLRAPLEGQISVKGSLMDPVVEGLLNISGGSVSFPMRELRILPGSTVRLHTDQSKQLTAYVDMEAQTRLVATSEWGQRRRYKVTMTAEGSMDQLNPRFSSSPPDLTEQRIVALLIGQRQLEQIFFANGPGGISRELPGLISTAIMPSLFEPIEEAFLSALGVEMFTLEMGYREPVQLTISEQLLDGLYLDYTAVLGARPDYADSLYEVRLSYRFRPAMNVHLTTSENRTMSVGVEGKLRF